jgi:DNA-binding MarR family transcriptional regulator
MPHRSSLSAIALFRFLAQHKGLRGKNDQEMTPTALFVLIALSTTTDPTLTFGEIADTLSIQRPTLSRIIERLYARKLLHRIRLVEDMRTFRVRLTAEGTAVVNEILEFWPNG